MDSAGIGISELESRARGPCGRRYRTRDSPHTSQLSKHPLHSDLLFSLFHCRVFLIIFFLILSTCSVNAQSPIGQALFISGVVEYRQAIPTSDPSQETRNIKPVSFQPWQIAKFRQPVYETDEFRTSQGSRLKIKFSDNSLVALGPNSTMRVSSYLFKPDQRLRQGVINVLGGLAMYIVNKSQSNKDSSLQIVSPTANIAARGTHGFASVSNVATIVANLAGSVATQNIDSSVAGQQVVGPMQKNVIAKGQPPTPPVTLTQSEASTIRSFALGLVPSQTTGRAGDKPLVQVEENREEKSDDSSESGTEQTGGPSQEAKRTLETKGSEEKSSGETGPGAGSELIGIAPGAFFQNIRAGTTFGNAVDFAPGNNPFQPKMMRGCGS